MTTKPITPYQRLLDAMRKFASKVEFPTRKFMWRYPKEKLGDQWTLTRLHERALAAEQIGFDVVLKPTDTGLEPIRPARRTRTRATANARLSSAPAAWAPSATLAACVPTKPFPPPTGEPCER